MPQPATRQNLPQKAIGKKTGPKIHGSRLDNVALQKRYLQAIMDGGTLTEAATICGMPPSSVAKYIEANPQFKALVEQAKAAAVMFLKSSIIGDKDWRAKAHALAMFFGDDFSKRGASDKVRADVALDFKAHLVNVLEMMGLSEHTEEVCQRMDQSMFPSRVVQVDVDFGDEIVDTKDENLVSDIIEEKIAKGDIGQVEALAGMQGVPKEGQRYLTDQTENDE
jgi:hypothetical protein